MKSTRVGRLLSEFGIVPVLLLLCVVFSIITYAEQFPEGADGGRQVAREVEHATAIGARVIIVVRPTAEDDEFAQAARNRLENSQRTVVAVIRGQPPEIRQALDDLQQRSETADAIAAHPELATKEILNNLSAKYPRLGNPRVIAPQSYYWPNFLKTDNLLNIANQIAVIAIIAIGMTMVIITGGIDLSVGSLMALAAVVTALGIVVAGGRNASAIGITLSFFVGIALCTCIGTISGLCVTLLKIPPFITTLSFMLIASGLAYIVSRGETIFDLSASVQWLGRGTAVAGVPNAVVLMLGLYGVSHFIMNRTVLGRYIYAVGGNAEAARLAGVPVRRVTVFAYAMSGLLAGLGGVIFVSMFRSASPNYGLLYEMYVIAAVVVGGTSLSGGEGRIIGTLLGAFLIAIIQNGMNLTGIPSDPQKIVLGGVILLAVFVDRLKQHDWNLLRLIRA